MALTISQPAHRADVWGRMRVRLVTVTFDSDLDEAGESLNAADVGLHEIYAVFPAGQAQSTSGAEVTGTVHYVYTTASTGTLHMVISDSDFAGDDLDASTYS